MNTLPALRAPLPVLVDEVLGLTARLHPDEALARLEPLWVTARPGIGQRALLAARIALMRKAMAAEPLVVGVVVPEVATEPEPVPEPVPVPAPVPAPKSLKAGALTLLNLDDVAKLLMASGEDEEEPAVAEAAGSPDLTPVDARAEAEAELAGVIAAEAAAVARAKGKKPKKREDAVVAKPAAFDLAAQFADMAGGAAPAMPDVMPDVMAAFAGRDEAGIAPDMVEVEVEAASAPVRAKKAAGAGVDLSAAFAEMGEAAPAPDLAPALAKAKKAGGMIDLSAQFAAMDGE